MKITQLASKPQLVKITLDSQDIISTFNEPIDFWTYDRQPLDIFMKLVNAEQSGQGEIINVVRTLILNQDGKQVIQGEEMLPGKVLIEAIRKIVELLGK